MTTTRGALIESIRRGYKSILQKDDDVLYFLEGPIVAIFNTLKIVVISTRSSTYDSFEGHSRYGSVKQFYNKRNFRVVEITKPFSSNVELFEFVHNLFLGE